VLTSEHLGREVKPTLHLAHLAAQQFDLRRRLGR
jgi:hypothetical protein